MTLETFTPRELVAELDRYIVGQKAAKRAVAVALRNRWRRQHVTGPLKDEITPKNILMIGPTGCGKTEIARRLAKLAKAPFIKVEASKFTEVGYVGRDVESMVRDLVEVAIKLVEGEALERVKVAARHAAEERVLERLLPPPQKPAYEEKSSDDPRSGTREKLRRLLQEGHLDEREIEIEVTEQRGAPMLDMLGGAGFDQMGINMKDALGGLFPKKSKKRRAKVKEALDILARDEGEKMIDRDAVQADALKRAQENGIIFLDEIDKIAGREGQRAGPDVSREGVQRDLLPIVEGSTVNTKYGMVKTDHILFIAAGAFHMTKVSDLIPELQGRFPIRVELETLSEADFVRILSEPENSLTRQYQALMETEAVHLEFTPDGIVELARFAFQVNERLENIGARRLHTVMERLLDELSFDAPDREDRVVVVDPGYVQRALAGIVQDPRLENYIL
ncbi:MAG: ATP-dependent protease ATPase subunit HslU [Deltaproteobacteria bacterium]|nr:ATP-dependent protease ATPase subunit HslU [Deltaproteobacteria bacterium]